MKLFGNKKGNNKLTINFKFHNHKKKDGTQSLMIRVRDRDQEKMIGISGVSIDKRYWDKKNQMVTAKHPNSEVINEVVSSFHNKIKKIKPLYELKNISFNDAIMMLEGSGSIDSMLRFINSVKSSKSAQWHKNTMNAVLRFGYYNKLKDPSFKDLSFNALEKMTVQLLKEGKQPETINQYLAHIRALFNYAKRKKVIYLDFEFPNSLMVKTRQHDKRLKTHLPKDIAEAIKNIKLKDQTIRSKAYTLRDFEAVGFWLLMFCMRGLYGKDITSLSAKDLNYDYQLKIDYEKKNLNSTRSIKGNPHFLDHKRHKTGNNMRIWLTLPPIGGLITILRKLVAQTHPEVSYLSADELKLSYDDLIKRKGYDGIKIFKHDPKTDIQLDDAIWNNLNKHLKKLGMYSLESARKTFATTCSAIGIDSSIERALLGQTDPSILKHYVNFEDKRLIYVTQHSHLKVLATFNTIELFDIWLQKMYEVFDFKNDFQIGAPSSVVYNDFLLSLPKIIQVDKTTIASNDDWSIKYSLERQKRTDN